MQAYTESVGRLWKENSGPVLWGTTAQNHLKTISKQEKLYMDLTQETKMIWLKIVLRQIMENEQSIKKGLPYGINWKVKSGWPLTQF